nr:DUF645 family protein [Vibrio cholerae]
LTSPLLALDVCLSDAFA